MGSPPDTGRQPGVSIAVNRRIGPSSPAPYLSTQLTAQGKLLTNYYAIGHNSLDNYIALVSVQAPNAVTQSDCQIYQDFIPSAPVQVELNGQIAGQGCVFPAEVQTINTLDPDSNGETRKSIRRPPQSVCLLPFDHRTRLPAPPATFP
jgi:hypothetical protein